MNGLRDAIDHTMLGWIKPELDEVLRQGRSLIFVRGTMEQEDRAVFAFSATLKRVG